MDDQARAVLAQVIATYSLAVCRTPRSCEMFLNQALADYPAERRALIAALRTGVVADLIDPAPEARWDELEAAGVRKLQTEGGLEEADARWTVESWGRVIGRHPATARPESIPTLRPAETILTDAQLTRLTVPIVAAGDAIGGGIGPGLVLMIFVSANKALKYTPEVHNKLTPWLGIALFMSFGFVGGGLGAALGWLYGKGGPGAWTAAIAAAGAAFGSAALGIWCCGPCVTVFWSFLSTFSAALHVANRGGYSR